MLNRRGAARRAKAELAEIDENLEGPDLSELEKGEHYATRKEIHLALYLQTANGGAQPLCDVSVAATRSAIQASNTFRDT